MTLSLKDPSHVPPGGLFSYMPPEFSASDKPLTASSYPSLLTKIRKYRAANGIAITGTFESEVQDNICKLLVAAGHPGECVDANHAFIPHDRRVAFSLSDAIQGTLTIGAFVLSGDRPVSQEVADLRAEICAGCEFNVEHGESCTNCFATLNKIEGVVTQLLGRCSTPSDAALKSCWHCGCFNKAQVWLPLKALQRFFPEEKNSQLPDYCWKKVKS